MQTKSSLSQRLIRIGAGLLVVALAAIGLTLWVTWQLKGGAAAVNEAGRLRMQTWRFVSSVKAQVPLAQRQFLLDRFERSLRLLEQGDATRPLFVPWDDQVRQRFAQVRSLWPSQRQGWFATPGLSSQELVESADHFVGAIDEFVSAIERQLSQLTAILYVLQLTMVLLVLGEAVVMLYAGYTYVINPLMHLQRGLLKIESGDFATRIEVPTQDEFGQVAAGFNRMAATLASLYSGLETQVEIKTKRIEAQRARLEALYEISDFLAKAPTIEKLSNGFAQRVRAVMKAQAVALCWSDEATQRYVMLASDGLPTDISEQERSLVEGVCACANRNTDALTQAIPILNHALVPIRNAALAGYTHMISVPVRLQQRLIGAINLFFHADVSLNSDEIEMLDTLASHLASAWESWRVAALEREAAVAEERSSIARELHDSIAQSLSFLKIQVQLLRAGVQKNQLTQVQTALDELDAGLRESVSDVRELLLHFRTRTNSLNIEQALQETLRKFEHQTHLPTHFQVHGRGLPLPPDVQVQVLHVIQEALSNVRKHAQATQVHLDVFKSESWRFQVCDDGVGFDADDTPGEMHVGLHIMRERALRIGAQVTITAQQPTGTTVTLSLPPYPVAAPEAPLAKERQDLPT